MTKQGAFGVDVGGTSIKIGLFASDGTLEEKWQIKTDTSENGKHILPDIASFLAKQMDERRLSPEEMEGVGIGVPGPVDERGLVRGCVNLGWGHVELVQEMEALCGMKVKASNDANVAALGELYAGSGKGYDSLVLATLGTGIGGGIVVNGKILQGAVGSGGEIGHITIHPKETRACTCGKKGCLEQYASATAMVHWAKHLLQKEDTPSVLRQGEVTAKTILEAAKAGDALALRVVDIMTEALGLGLANVAAVCDPQLILIGGGVSAAGAFLTDRITAHYKQYAFPATKETPIRTAALGNDAGMVGAAFLLLGEVSR